MATSFFAALRFFARKCFRIRSAMTPAISSSSSMGTFFMCGSRARWPPSPIVPPRKMFAPAKRKNDEGKMKAVAGANIFLGGTIGEGGHLALDPHMKNVPIDDEDEIAGVIAGLMKENFGAVDRVEVPKEVAMSR